MGGAAVSAGKHHLMKALRRQSGPRQAWSTGLVGLLCLLGLLWAGELRVVAQDRADGWQAALKGIGEQLLMEDFESAERASVALAGELIDSIVGGSGADLLLAMTATYRAVAVAGQGRGDEAIWYWQVAQQLFPQVAEIDLTRFGPAAGFLRMHPPRRPAAGRSSAAAGIFEPPVKLEAPLPDFPDGRAFRGLRIDVVVQVVVGIDGLPREPLILSSKGEHTLVWATLEALRKWRFEPARRDGKPESALYKLTASYVVPEG